MAWAQIALDRGLLASVEEAVRQAETLARADDAAVRIWRMEIQAELARRHGDYRHALAKATELQRLLESGTRLAIRPGVRGAVLLRSIYYCEALHPDKALVLAEAALRGLTGEDTYWVKAVNVLGGVLSKVGRFEECERLRRQELAYVRKSTTPASVHVAAPLINLASVLARQGKADEAGAVLREAGEHEAVLHPDERSTLCHGRGLAEATVALRESIALDEAWPRPGHPKTVDGLWALAQVVEAAGQPDEAAALRARVEAIRQAYVGID